MSNNRKGVINGVWLKKAVKAQGKTYRQTAEAMGLARADKFTSHTTNKSYLNAESLAQLALLFPTMNMRFVLTGEGSPLL